MAVQEAEEVMFAVALYLERACVGRVWRQALGRMGSLCDLRMHGQRLGDWPTRGSGTLGGGLGSGSGP